MKIDRRMLAAALRTMAGKNDENATLMMTLANDLEATARPPRALMAACTMLIGITDVPDETWSSPQPTKARGTEDLGGAIDRLSKEWPLSDLHQLVAVRRVAWAATQLARVIEKDFAKTLALSNKP